MYTKHLKKTVNTTSEICFINFNPSPLVPDNASVNRVSIGTDNGLSPIRRQAIIQTNVGLFKFKFNKVYCHIWNTFHW